MPWFWERKYGQKPTGPIQFGPAIWTFKLPKRSGSSSTRYGQYFPTCLSPTSPGNRSHRKTLITYYTKAMSLLRNAIKSSVSLRTIKPIHSLPSLLRQSPKHFSTETEAPPPPPPNDASIDLFLQTPTKGTNSVAFLELT